MADYAISNVPRRVVYAASGVGPYAFTFEILSASDIAVYKASTLLTLTTDYSVTINANGTGSVTLVTSAGTSNITIVGAKNIQRTTDFTTGGDFFANTLNDELDAQTIFIQQVAETAERGLKAPVVDPTDINMTLPAKTTRAGTVLAFNATTGNPEVGPTIASVATVAAQSANINTVATNIASVNTVAGDNANINTVAGNNSNISTVAGISSNVTTVAGISSNVSTVATNNANVTTVAANIAAVNTNATNIVAIQNASTNATNAADSATAASNSATAAGNAQTAAESARDATLAAFDSFDDRYLGTKTSDPTLDNDGNALLAGALYFNSVVGEMRVYTGSAWVAAYVSGTGFLVASNNLSDLNSVSTARTNLGLGTIATQASSNVSITGGAINGTTLGATTPSSGSFTSLTDSGNLTFTGTGNRILGDFSNATVAKRVAFQTSTVNGITNVGILPNGTGISALLTAFSSSSDPANASTAQFGLFGTEARITSGITGTGTYLPMTFYTGGSERMRLDTSGNLGIGTASPIVPLDIYNSTAAVIRLQGDSIVNTQLAKYSTDNQPAVALIRKGRGTVASPSAVASGDNMGSITFQAYGGTNNRSLAAITGVVSTYTSDTDISSYLNFSTTATGGVSAAERMRIDSAGNVGIGTSSPSYNLHVRNASGNSFIASQFGTGTIGLITAASNQVDIKAFNGTNDILTFTTGASERARIDSSGGLRIKTTSNIFNSPANEALSVDNGTNGSAATFSTNATGGYPVLYLRHQQTGSQSQIGFYSSAGLAGSIQTTGLTTAYNTSSDYRLKENVQPMTGALAKVAALNPCTYTWKSDGSEGEGFIAHELAEVCPSAVTGEKDAVNEDGSIKPQGIDTSFLVATLTAALQEAHGLIKDLQARVESLENA